MASFDNAQQVHSPSILSRYTYIVAHLLIWLFVMMLGPHIVQAGDPRVEQYSKTPEAAKINVNLLRLDHDMRAKGISLSEAASDKAVIEVAGGIALDIVVDYLDPRVEAKFVLPGVRVRHFSTKYRRVSVVIDDPALLYELAKIPEVRMISPEYGTRTNTSTLCDRVKAESPVPRSACRNAR